MKYIYAVRKLVADSSAMVIEKELDGFRGEWELFSVNTTRDQLILSFRAPGDASKDIDA